VLHSINIDLNSISTKYASNEGYFTWIVYPPWKNRIDLFNDKPYNNSGSITFPLSIQSKNKRKRKFQWSI
jgi:hypothetical protein